MVASGRCRGFTLLEVLMAVVLLAMLLGLAWASLRTAVQATRSGEALIERSEQLRTVHGFLRRQFSQAMPLAYERLEDAGAELRFEGAGDGVRFVAPMPGYLSRGGPHVQTLVLSGVGRGLQLAFSHQQLNGYDPDDPQPVGEPVILIEGIASGRFEFRALDNDGQIGDWSEDWEDPQRLPLLVRLTLEFDRDDPRRWPALEIPVLASSAGLPAAALGRGLRPRFGRPGAGPPPGKTE